MDCTFCPLKHIHSMLGQPNVAFSRFCKSAGSRNNWAGRATIDRNCIDGGRGNVIIRDCRATRGGTLPIERNAARSLHAHFSAGPECSNQY